MESKSIFLLIALCISCVKVFAQKQDTLYAKKAFFSTHIYKDSVKLSKKHINQLFHDTWQPKIKYKWSNVLKPVGALTTIGGIGLTYVAIKGTNYLTNTEGKQVSYKVISLPQLTIGVGLIVVGYSIFESSNLLAQRSVDVYNNMLRESKKTGYINRIQFGLTDNNSIGFSVFFK
jgi:hypothetical protein